MTSIEIAKERKKIEVLFQKEANIINGQLTNAKNNFDLSMKKLQKKCSHMWDTGESGIQHLEGLSICTICRKKFRA